MMRDPYDLDVQHLLNAMKRHLKDQLDTNEKEVKDEYRHLTNLIFDQELMHWRETKYSKYSRLVIYSYIFSSIYLFV